MCKEEEQKVFRQLHFLNHFYAFTVFIAVLVTFFLLFNLNRDQRSIIDDLTKLVEVTTEQSELRDRMAEDRLSRALETLEATKDEILNELENAELKNLEDSILERIEQLITDD